VTDVQPRPRWIGKHVQHIEFGTMGVAPKTLKEEEATDVALTRIAESVVNQEAQQSAE
jgi:hypothetical protein